MWNRKYPLILAEVISVMALWSFSASAGTTYAYMGNVFTQRLLILSDYSEQFLHRGVLGEVRACSGFPHFPGGIIVH